MINWYRIAQQAKEKNSKFENGEHTDMMDEEGEKDNVDGEHYDSSPVYKSPHEMDLDKAYEMFSDSYQKATGKTWDKQKFLNRSGNWIFFGDENGYIAVRPQASGLYKLVGIAGDDSNPISKGRSLIKAFRDLMSEGKPTWGMVSEDLKNKANSLGMKSPSPLFIKTLLKIFQYIPDKIFGGAEIKNVSSDGGVTFEYGDIGEATKYFVANDLYYQWLKENIDQNERIPKAIKFLLKKAVDKVSQVSTRMMKTSVIVSFSNELDILEV